MHSQQKALKLFMNVMYGYTAAGFSGRMPCVEIADAIISTAKNLLYQSIQTIEALSPPFCRVVYGDTDSLFFLMQGVQGKKAHTLSFDLLKQLNRRFHSPLELKFEKIYSSFVSFGKKRYAGIKSNASALETKGLENIRTDSFPFLQTFYQKALDFALRQKNLSQIRALYQSMVSQTVRLISLQGISKSLILFWKGSFETKNTKIWFLSRSSIPDKNSRTQWLMQNTEIRLNILLSGDLETKKSFKKLFQCF